MRTEEWTYVLYNVAGDNTGAAIGVHSSGSEKHQVQ